MNKLIIEKCFYFLLALYFTFHAATKVILAANAIHPPLPPPVTYEWNFESTAIWTDEFTTDGAPDATKWGYDIGGTGWGNNELQYYTDGLNAQYKCRYY